VLPICLVISIITGYFLKTDAFSKQAQRRAPAHNSPDDQQSPLRDIARVGTQVPMTCRRLAVNQKAARGRERKVAQPQNSSMWMPSFSYINLTMGRLGGSVVKCLPSAQVMILGSWDRAPHWAPCSAGSLLLPLPLLLPLLCTLSLSLTNKIFKKNVTGHRV